MSLQSPEPSAATQDHRPIRRFGIGALSTVQIICVTLIVVALNYLSTQHVITRDLSGDASYTLSSSSIRLLESPLVRDRKEPIRLIVAYRATADYYERIRALAEQYALHSNGKIEVEFLDPVRSPDATERKNKEYGGVFASVENRSLFSRDLLIVDARSPEQKEAATRLPGRLNPKASQEEIQAAAQAHQLAGSSHVRFIDAEATKKVTEVERGARRAVAFLGEDAITTGLLRAIEGKPRILYVLADKSNFGDGGQASSWGSFERTLISRNVIPLRINLAEIQEIPEDASAIAILNPAYDFSLEQIAILEKYWNRSRSGIFVTLGSSDVPPNFRSFLRNQGVAPQANRIVASKRGDISTIIQSRFLPGMDFTQDFAGKAILFEGATCGIDVRDTENDSLVSNGISPYALIETGNDSWGESRFGAGSIQFDPREDTPGPIRIAGAVIRGSSTHDDVGSETSKMVVIGNTDMFDPSRYTNLHRDFVASSMDWIVGQEAIAGFGPRTFGIYKLPLLTPQVSFINRVNLFFLPALALVTGLIVWTSRRA